MVVLRIDGVGNGEGESKEVAHFQEKPCADRGPDPGSVEKKGRETAGHVPRAVHMNLRAVALASAHSWQSECITLGQEDLMITMTLSEEDASFLLAEITRRAKDIETELVHTDARDMQRDLADELKKIERIKGGLSSVTQRMS